MLEYSIFRKLPPWMQAQELAQKGAFLAIRYHKDWTIKLYYIDNRFVEVWGRGDLQVVGTFLEPANALHVVEPYLGNLDVQDFLN
ncbi:hypothetical protein TH61_12255 [Rufibacter sp. DG15C]|uniref:hypothetical protein n=1 Tax=Rufibacter sp. DG15C TaxID=1379909 RepID=UPI00078C2910|nr:hypothetical protein [Rufibacter sp. DG15C]AMM51796.1 hypothetical protein TH61_12255 [Rufibacter sp. DG15C]